MSSSLAHLLIVPIVLPLVTAALMLSIADRQHRLKSALGIGAALAHLLVSLSILRRVDGDGGAERIAVYLAANWEAPFGIVLVADRLSALMLVLTSVVGLGAVVYAAASWSRAGVYFHPLFQIQLMGLSGAFLTGDLFNLFVFFEVMLAASYGLQLHGSGGPRVHSGLHYIAVNLLASALFLVGLAMLYGVTGTLTMADVAAKIPLVSGTDRGLLHAGAAILAVAFLTKAAAWPLHFWLVPAYVAASAPVAAVFALMTKVGVYTLLRLSTLFFAAHTGPSELFGASTLLYGGLATLAVGVLGVMGSMRLARVASFSIIVSAGTLLSALGIGTASLTSAALFYLLSATLGASALFLLIELLDHAATGARGTPRPDVETLPDEDTNLDDDEAALVGRAIPVSRALHGLAFLACMLIVAGLPPLSGFLAKLALMSALLSPDGLGQGSAGSVAASTWCFLFLLLLAGLVTTIAMTRAGMRHFWSSAERPPPRLTVVEGVPVLGLLLAAIWLGVQAEPVLRYTNKTAAALHAPRGYIVAVLSARPLPGPTRPLEAPQEAP